MSAPTVQEVIDRARVRHFSFSDGNEGAAVQFCDEAQRVILLSIIKTAEAIIGATEEIDVEGTVTLVAVDSLGVPYFTTTVEDGYAIRFDANNVPYVDVSEPFVSDPFGSTGDTPGLPLPTDLLRIISVSAMTLDSDITPREIEVLPQETVQKAATRSGGLRAFVSANRLIPIRTAEADAWARVTSIRLGFVQCPALTALSDLITIPTPCIHTLTAHLAEWMAVQSAKCPQADKRWFQQQRVEADDTLQATINSLEGIVTNTILYKR